MFQLKVTQKALITQMNLSGLCFSAYFDMDGGKDGALAWQIAQGTWKPALALKGKV